MGILLLLALSYSMALAHCQSLSVDNYKNVIEQKPGLEVFCKMDGCANMLDPGNATISHMFLREFHRFQVENHTVTFYAFNKEYVEVYCAGWNALDSKWMPRFTQKLRLSWLVLNHCPPPHNQSFVEAFARINVDVRHITAFELKSLPRNPQLTSYHLKYMESVTEFTVNDVQHENPEPEPGFLIPLKNLQILHVSNVKISAEDMKNITSLTQIHLTGKALLSLLVQN